MGKHSLTLEERILERARLDIDGCFRWTGATTTVGYGKLGMRGKFYTVHLVAYELFVGPIPDGMDVGHKCHDAAAEAGLCLEWSTCVHRTCLRPDHLKPEPRGDNLLSSPLTQASINSAKTECKRGHEFTEANTYIKKSGWRSCRICNKMTPEERRAWDEAHGL